MHKNILYIVCIALFVSACKSVDEGFFSKKSPHEAYTSRLSDAGLDDYKLGKSWRHNAEESLLKAVETAVPFSEAVVFGSGNATTASYRVSLTEGQHMHILAIPEQSDSSLIFIDLFQLKEGEIKQVSFAEKNSNRLGHKIKRDGEYIIRIQPELLAQGLYMVYLFTDASLNFPVPDRDFRSISSFYGDPRDGGRRKHEGVDVFAPRGTPVLAVSNGRIARTGTNRLGGKIIWLTDIERGYNYYYAHLDSQFVQTGRVVGKGDTLGIIGNTGNAVTTPPHLHFGIYAFGRRSIDPYAFFHRTDMPEIDTLQVDRFAAKWGLISSSPANFRSAPDLNAEIHQSLPPDFPLRIIGVAGKWLRVELPHGEKGFVHHSLVAPLEKPLRTKNASEVVVRYHPDVHSRAKAITEIEDTISIYTGYASFFLVGVNNIYGWIKADS